jgi:hypothetical protein
MVEKCALVHSIAEPFAIDSDGLAIEDRASYGARVAPEAGRGKR